MGEGMGAQFHNRCAPLLSYLDKINKRTLKLGGKQYLISG